MEALKTQNNNYLVKNSDDCAYFTPQGIFIKRAPLSEWEWAVSTWGVEVINMNFMFPEDDDRADYSLNEIVLSFIKQNNIYFEPDNTFLCLTFQEPENFTVVWGFDMLDFHNLNSSHYYYHDKDNDGDFIAKRGIGLVPLKGYTLLYSYCEDLEDENIYGSFTIIKGSFDDQIKETVELTESFKALKFEKFLETIN